ncbi:MAG: hypothetical protein LBR79_00805 [Oscillospiraceae bacterium]|nr:hypothetical protein [Oscillospiraceae bacterium]
MIISSPPLPVAVVKEEISIIFGTNLMYSVTLKDRRNLSRVGNPQRKDDDVMAITRLANIANDFEKLKKQYPNSRCVKGVVVGSILKEMASLKKIAWDIRHEAGVKFKVISNDSERIRKTLREIEDKLNEIHSAMQDTDYSALKTTKGVYDIPEDMIAYSSPCDQTIRRIENNLKSIKKPEDIKQELEQNREAYIKEYGQEAYDKDCGKNHIVNYTKQYNDTIAKYEQCINLLKQRMQLYEEEGLCKKAYSKTRASFNSRVDGARDKLREISTTLTDYKDRKPPSNMTAEEKKLFYDDRDLAYRMLGLCGYWYYKYTSLDGIRYGGLLRKRRLDREDPKSMVPSEAAMKEIEKILAFD